MARRVSPLLAVVTALGADQQLARGQLGSALHIAVAGGSRGNLEGEQSPWEERATRRWKRRRIATDSSVEKRPEVGASSGAALTVPSGNRRCGRYQSVPSACATRSSGLARPTSRSRAASTRSPTPASAEEGAHRASAAVLGRPPRRWCGRCRPACWPAAYLAPPYGPPRWRGGRHALTWRAASAALSINVRKHGPSYHRRTSVRR